jgi:hypothetical protein
MPGCRDFGELRLEIVAESHPPVSAVRASTTSRSTVYCCVPVVPASTKPPGLLRGATCDHRWGKRAVQGGMPFSCDSGEGLLKAGCRLLCHRLVAVLLRIGNACSSTTGGLPSGLLWSFGVYRAGRTKTPHGPRPATHRVHNETVVIMNCGQYEQPHRPLPPRAIRVTDGGLHLHLREIAIRRGTHRSVGPH